MMDYFDEQIDTLLTNDDDILVAMELQANKDSSVLLGNEELTKSNL